MANYLGGYAIIDFGGQALSTTPITIPGSYAKAKSGKPIVLQNVTFDASLPGTTVVVSMASWDSADDGANFVMIFGETYIHITSEDAIAIEE